MRKSLRTGKVFVDWSQNAEHKTTVCVYSLRAMAQPTVSTPLLWEEVEAAVGVRRPGGADVHVLRRARARGRARRPVRSRRRAGAGAPGLERSGRGLDAALEVGAGVDRAEVDVRRRRGPAASSPEMPVMITREPSRRSAATVPSSCPATRESISGTPVTSITTTRARRARTSASSRSSIWWARSSSSAPMIGQHEDPRGELQDRRGELEDRLLLGALELLVGVAQLAVGVAQAHAAVLELGPADLQRVRHRVERARERGHLAGAPLGRAGARLAAREPAGGRRDVAHGRQHDPHEIGDAEREAQHQDREADGPDHERAMLGGVRVRLARHARAGARPPSARRSARGSGPRSPLPSRVAAVSSERERSGPAAISRSM